MSILLNTAHAAQSAAVEQSSFPMLFIMLAFFASIYFMIIRPQNKKQQELNNIISKLAIGDEVVTNGGVVGVITKLSGNYLFIKTNDIEICLQKNAISNVMPKGMVKEINANV